MKWTPCRHHATHNPQHRTNGLAKPDTCHRCVAATVEALVQRVTELEQKSARLDQRFEALMFTIEGDGR